MNIKTIFNEFKSQVAFTLLLVWLLAIWHLQTLNSILYPLFAVVLMTSLDVGYTWLRFKKLYWPSASFVTGFLIGLIIDPREPIWIIALAVLAAFISKQFIGVGLRQHIFNPAAFGIMTVAFVSGTPVAWWGVVWGKLPLVILIPAMARILWRMKRLWLPLTFVAVYFFYFWWLFNLEGAINSVVDGAFLLFALVMLPEPITSPTIKYFKLLFGALVAILAIALSYLKISSEVFLPALLVANLIGFFIVLRLNKKRAEVVVKDEERKKDRVKSRR